MTEKVVYILGAGFSAPLGLPVMSNFYEKSMKQFDSNREVFAHFQDIFREFDITLKAKHLYRADLLNIEDILSILEFRVMYDSARRNQFLNYIKQVILFYTPPPPTPVQLDSIGRFETKRWEKAIFGSQKISIFYGSFVASILRCSFVDTHSPGISGYDDIPYLYVEKDTPDIEYSVVTLNYDRVLEQFAEHLFRFESKKRFWRTVEDKNSQSVFLAKVHGSVETTIVAPTWNKALDLKDFEDWRVAYKVLSELAPIQWRKS